MNNSISKETSSHYPADCLKKQTAECVENLSLKTDSDHADEKLQAFLELAKILKEQLSAKDFLNRVTRLIQQRSGCKCVGIRVLSELGDVPYESFVGFSKRFWEAENWLSYHCNDCPCIRVLHGEKETFNRMVISANGSFYCGNIADFCAGLPPEAQKGFRGFCIKNGYFSVAAVPILHQEKVIGFIHMADPRADWIRLKTIEEVELLTPFVGETLYRFSVENELRNIIDFTDDAIISFTMEGWVTHWNSGAEKLYGYAASEIIGRPYSMLVPPELYGEYQTICEMLRKGENIQIYQTTRMGKDGRKIDVSISLSSARDIHGNLFGVTAIHRDISKSKLMEAELEKAHRLESLGMLAGGIAHDFNNYLAAIMANVQLIEIMAAKGKPVEKYLRETITIAQNAASLTKQLLVFAKGGAPIKKQASMTEFLTRITQMTLHETRIQSKFVFAADLWEAEFDESQLSLVITNLLNNAVQAMPGGGMIEIRAENAVIGDEPSCLLKQGDYLRVTLTDTGEGISPENLGKIFDPFFTTRAQNKGLGLTITYSVLQRHGGWIDVQSVLGKGSTFQIYLPAVRQQMGRMKTDGEAENPPQGRILLMDDEQMLLDSMGELLSDLGYQVGLAQDGAAAMTVYQQALAEGKPLTR
jgi:PAS domain S-box-containing protein